MQLVEIARWAEVPADAMVIAEGDPADVVRVIASGRVSLALRIPGRRDEVVSTLSQGELLGWSALTPGSRWSASARAVRACRFIVLPQGALLARCDADPKLGYAVMRRAVQAAAARLNDARLQLTDMFHGRR